MPNKVRPGRWERTEPAFRKKWCLPHTAFRRRNGWNGRKVMAQSPKAAPRRLTRPGCSPWWEDIKCGAGRRWQRPGLCHLSVCLSHTQTLPQSLSFEEKSFLMVKKKNFEGEKKTHRKSPGGGMEATGGSSQVSDPRVKGARTRWGFNSLQSEKHASHPVNLQTRFSRFRTFSSII